jgi:non-reducing end alpha-L-arabinofuranosidase
MKRIWPILLVSVGAAALAILPTACGNYSAGEGSGGASGSGTGGGAGSSSSVGTGGSGTVGTGGSNIVGTGGSSTVGTGGSTTASNGGSPDASIGTGGSVTRTGGSTTVGAGGAAGSTAAAGGAPGAGGATVAQGGAPGAGGAPGTGGATGGDSSLPCDVVSKAPNNKCVAAHSTVRVIVSGYTGPLYELCKGTANVGPASCKGTKQDVGSKDGYVDAAAHEAFCPAGTACTITKIYDQSGQKNDLEPAPKGNVCGADKPANANDLKVTVNGHTAYGIMIKQGIGYRTGCTGCTVKTGSGMVKGDDPESMYWVTSQKNLIDGCCFDYGNAETSSNDDGNGTMETLYFGGGVVWGTGSGGKPGPWIMADLENGLYAGWENKQDKNISTNTKLAYDFVTGVLLGDTKEKNSNKGRFALYGGDATTGTLKTMYDGVRPEKPGYVPMTKQGSIILGIGGDNSCSAGGHFYEGAITAGPVWSKEIVDALQTAIVAAKYGK